MADPHLNDAIKRARGTDAREVGAGALFMAFGAAVIIYAQQYDLGTATEMGPGYFPCLLGALLVLLGAIAVVQGRRRAAPVAIGAWPALPTVFILASVLAFALLVDAHGLIPAVVATILLGCYERLLRRPLEVAAITVALVALTVSIFHYGIQLPFRLW
jgi:hypothetical protein